MRILITGGFGFVGGRLAQYLDKCGHQVILGSRSIKKIPEWLPQSKIVKSDWDNNPVLEEICRGIDVVIHAAGMNAQDCTADPVSAMEFNGLATARLLYAAIRSGVKRFIYLSTAHVYASPLTGTITEENCPLNLHPYATSHVAGENAVLYSSQRGQIEGIILRMSNVFGAPVDKDANCWMLVVNELARQVVETGKLILKTSGLQQRDFISMSEINRIIEQLAILDSDDIKSGIINLGSGVSQSVYEIAQLIKVRSKLILGINPDIQHLEALPDEKNEKLEYRMDKLIRMGIKVQNDLLNEIDSLLAFCQTSYRPKKIETI